jgi:superinfection exclusion protein B
MDLGQWIKELRETIGSTKTWAFLFVVAVLPLCLPQAVAAFLGIVKLRDQWRPWLGALAVVSFAGLLVAAGSKAVGLWQRRRRRKLLLASLRTLSLDEKQLLSSYMTPRTTTRYFDLEDGIVAGLAVRGILYRPTAMVDLAEGAAFNLLPSVWNELMETIS